MGVSALDSELLASTSKKQRWRSSTLRESCRAAFRYLFFIQDIAAYSCSRSPLLGAPKLKDNLMANQIQKMSGRKTRAKELQGRSKSLLMLNHFLCCNVLWVTYHVSATIMYQYDFLYWFLGSY